MSVEKCKKKLVLIPSAYNSKVMGDVESFIDYYKDKFDLYVISDKYENIKIEKDGVKYVNNKSSFANYLKTTADYIIDAGSINGRTKFSKTQKRISVWHGVPYKKMFTDLDIEHYQTALEYCYGTDLMVSPSKFYSDKFLRDSMLYNGEILETAVARTDSLFLSEEEQNNIKNELGIPRGKKVLLYAPTYRKEGKVSLPFDSKAVLRNLPENNWVIVTKFHYLNVMKKDKNVIDCTNYPVVNNLLSIADLLVTDYSSLFFDYSVLDKPAIFYQYDKEEYEKDRGFMFELSDYVESKYIVESENEFYNLLSSADEIKSNLAHIKREFYPHQKANSTSELVKELNLDDTQRGTKEIIFLVNDLNQIGGVHNFVLNLAKEFKKKYNSKIIVIGKNEFAKTNEKIQFFDRDNLVDIKISKENNLPTVKRILRNTDGYIIGCQFGAFISMQRYLKDKKAVLMFHGDTKDVVARNFYVTHLNKINNNGVRNYKKFLLLTEGNMKVLAGHVNAGVKEKLGYIENGFNFSDRKNCFKKNNEFVCVTRLDVDKNPFDLIEIFKNKNLNPAYKVHVYGDGPLKKSFENKIAELNLESKIIVHGYCDNKDEIYKDKQGLIMTSLSEGFPYVILEAYKYGIPVYSYNSFTAAAEEIADNVGVLVEAGNIEQYVSALNNAKDVENSDFDYMLDKFSNNTIVEKWMKLFEELDQLGCDERLDLKQNTTKPNSKQNGLRLDKKAIKKRILESESLSTSNFYVGLTAFKLKLTKLFKKNNESLVSIVVPFYNNNKTLKAALKSVKKSGYKNYEIIVVNDGSSEDPSEIVNKFKNVRYYYKENEGLGLTRNFAIDKAKGEYVFFLDSDDELCKGSLSALVDYAQKENLPVVCGLCRRVYYNTKKVCYWMLPAYKKKTVNSAARRDKIICDTLSTSKLYNLRELRKSNIVFEEGLYEDVLFTAKIYNYFDRIGVIPNVVYSWYIYGKNTSITTSIRMRNVRDRIAAHDEIMSFAVENYKVQYMKEFITNHMYVILNSFNNFSENEQKEIYEMIRNHLLKYRYYIYEKLVRVPEKKHMLDLILDNNFDEFLKIAKLTSSVFSRTIKALTGQWE